MSAGDLLGHKPCLTCGGYHMTIDCNLKFGDGVEFAKWYAENHPVNEEFFALAKAEMEEAMRRLMGRTPPPLPTDPEDRE